MRRAFLMGIVVLLARPAAAQDYEAAGNHFTAAQDAYAKKSFGKAAAEFEAAYQITKDPVLLFNIAESYERAGEGRKAVTRYKLYLAESPHATDRAEVEKKLAALEKKYPEVIEPSGGALLKPVLDLPAPASPGDKLAKPDFGTPAPTPKPASPPAAAPAPAALAPTQGGLLDDQKRTSGLRAAGWITAAGAVALATAGAILGLAAETRAYEVTRRQTFVGADGQPARFDAEAERQLKSLYSEGELFNYLGIGLLSGGGAFAVTSIILFIVDARRGREAKHVQLSPLVGSAVAGATAQWEF